MLRTYDLSISQVPININNCNCYKSTRFVLFIVHVFLLLIMPELMVGGLPKAKHAQSIPCQRLVACPIGMNKKLLFFAVGLHIS